MIRQKLNSRTNKEQARIIIVDDHPIVREGLETLINCEKSLTVCRKTENTSQTLKAIREEMPDLVIVDISLKDENGLELIKDIGSRYPDLPVLALSMHEESLYAERVIRAGASGYIMKQQATENIINAIQTVLGGQVYLSQNMTARMVSSLTKRKKDKISISEVEILSDRELEVFLLIGKGYGTSQIADLLCLSVKTIESYRAHIKEKLSLKNATELLQYAIQWSNSQQ